MNYKWAMTAVPVMAINKKARLRAMEAFLSQTTPLSMVAAQVAAVVVAVEAALTAAVDITTADITTADITTVDITTEVTTEVAIMAVAMVVAMAAVTVAAVITETSEAQSFSTSSSFNMIFAGQHNYEATGLNLLEEQTGFMLSI